MSSREVPMTEMQEGCVKPTRGPLVSMEETGAAAVEREVVTKVLAQVGKTAPDFETSGYLEGGFKEFKLSDLRGEWVVLCFYPGDFTFV